MIELILQHYGVEVNEGYGWQKCRCPHPDHQDRTPSASVNTEVDAFLCHGCGMKAGGLVSLVEKIEGCDRDSALRKVKEIFGRSGKDLPAAASRGRRGDEVPDRGEAVFERGHRPLWSRGSARAGRRSRELPREN